MTVNELIDWLKSAKRIGEESGQEVGGYQVQVPYNSACEGPIQDGKVDHGKNIVSFWSDE